MIAEDVVFLLVIVVPLFVARWRVSLLGLALQGALLFRAAHGDPWLDGIDFLAVRGALAPAILYTIQLGSGHPGRKDVIPANLFAWVLVVVLVTVAFRFAAAMAPGAESEGRLAVATAALVLGLFVLSSQNSVFAQIVGVLRVENAVALFELAVREVPPEPGVRVAQLAVTAGLCGMMAWYLRALHDAPVAE
ncbi:MAG: hypothetical protein ABMA64_19210 [Myxococcota bacterium]